MRSSLITFAPQVYYRGFEEHGWQGGNYMIDGEFWGLVAKRGKARDSDGPLWRVTYGDSAANLSEEQYLKRRELAFKKMLPGHPDPSQYKVAQTDQFRIHNRCVDKMRVGRIFLAGDAAHVCNPFGGYGCMAAVLDVAGLADCLIGYHEDKADDDIFDAYAKVRRDKFVDFIDRRSRKNLDRISKTDASTALETDPFLAMLKGMEGDAEETRKFLMVCLLLYSNTLAIADRSGRKRAASNSTSLLYIAELKRDFRNRTKKSLKLKSCSFRGMLGFGPV